MVNKNIIEETRKFVEQECEKPDAHFKGAFPNHFVHVAANANRLAEKENSDEEIVEIAAWLHDVGSIRGDYDNHHLVSAKIAEEFLKKLNYPEEKIQQVVHCILNHRGSVLGKPETKEAKILIDADSMAHFDEIPFLVKGKYYGARTIEDSKKNVLAKLERSYKKLSDEAKQIIKPKLEKARIELK